jgi:hypothetical protein
MPILQKEIDSPGAKLRALFVGKGKNLSAMRQDLATWCHAAAIANWIWRHRRGGFFNSGSALAPRARWRGFGVDVVPAAVHICGLARNVCVAGQFSVEMRIA